VLRNSRLSVRQPMAWVFVCLIGPIGCAKLLLSGRYSPVARSIAPVARRFRPQVQRSESYGKLPLAFEENQGQADSQVQYLSRSRGVTLFLNGSGAVMKLQRKSEPLMPTRRSGLLALGTIPPETGGQTGSLPSGLLGLQPQLARTPSPTSARSESPIEVGMKLLNINTAARVEGLDRLPGISNYYIGDDPAKWHTNISQYRKVCYHDIYSGIDMVYYGDGRNLEYDFVIRPGANPNAIRLSYVGVDRVSVASDGDLVLEIAGEEIRQGKPVVYQEGFGKHEEIAGHYWVDPKTREARFIVMEYDHARTLTIDPVLVYATYIGGNSNDSAEGVAVDSFGQAYMAGTTISTSFSAGTGLPASAGAYGSQSGQKRPTGVTPDFDVFVTKLNSDGTAVLFSAYLGGSSYDVIQGISLDSSGNPCITGLSYSADFPHPGSLQSFKGSPYVLGPVGTDHGVGNAFVAKLSSTGATLFFSTFLGGSGGIRPNYFEGIYEHFGDAGLSIAVNTSNSDKDSIYILGETASLNFPTTTGGYRVSPPGSGDLFVTKLNPSGSALVYSTYLGGTDFESTPAKLRVDSAGNAYIVGYTFSQDFPTTPGVIKRTLGGYTDAFVTKLNTSGSGLVSSTYLGGSDDEGDFGDIGFGPRHRLGCRFEWQCIHCWPDFFVRFSWNCRPCQWEVLSDQAKLRV
jgi:hypothetical protein